MSPSQGDRDEGEDVAWVAKENHWVKACEMDLLFCEFMTVTH